MKSDPMIQPTKFRIWDKQSRRFVNNDSSLHCYSNWSISAFTGKIFDCVGVVDGDHGDNFTVIENPDYFIVGFKAIHEPRYVTQIETTLKDKDGKLIYVGDIIRSIDDEHNYEVVFVDGSFCIQFPDGTYAYLWDYLSDGLVIGNIFENKYLLEHEKELHERTRKSSV